ASLGIPKLFLVMTLPLVIGLLTGLTQAVVAISFPVLLGLTLTPHLITLAFVAGFAGVMLSPVHLCLVLTVDYFKTTMGRIYSKILTGEGILLGTAVIFALLYNK
ncbi:MAG TPA: DUF401 family protein, partial [Verrucomicrobiae bacterium]|nr:DUF401 family protein [Verrucomicrobiae bacterium]